MPSRPQMGNAMSSFGRGAHYSGPTGMSRVPSQGMSMPHSPGGGRQASRQKGSSRNPRDGADSKKMPLTQGVDLKPLEVSQKGWKPTNIGNKAAQGPVPGGAGGYMEPEMVQRKVKAALNKMTPEKFDKIADQILIIAEQSKDETDGRTLRQVIQLTFEKATDEAHWASMYAKFCKRMLDTMSDEIKDENIRDKLGKVVSGGALFRKYLLNRCQEEFLRGWSLKLPEAKDQNDKKEKGGCLDVDEYYVAAAAKRRGLGLVQFIGELFKLNMLTERIMHECVKKLVDYQGVPDEAEIESLCKLLRTVGANLDSTEKSKGMMDIYFQRIKAMMDISVLNSRMKFMLLDVVDLRRDSWLSKEGNKGPKTLDEVRAEV